MYYICCYINAYINMKQRRLTKEEKVGLFAKYETGNYTAADLSKEYPISNNAINALLRRHGYEAKSQSELQRKYDIDETFFDVIDTEEKAYFLGILYADGYNNTDRNSVALSLKEGDKSILIKLNSLLQPNKPLQYVHIKYKNSSDQYRLVIANKHISKKLVELGCDKAKTFKIIFPTEEQVPINLINHFVRGYFDGDGCVQPRQCNITSTEKFCFSLKDILSQKGINCTIDTRFPERNNNIRTLHISGRKQLLKFLDWIYENSTVYLDRKHEIYLMKKEYKKETRVCCIDGCNKKHFSNGYCKNHYYKFCNGKEKRHKRWIEKKK